MEKYVSDGTLATNKKRTKGTGRKKRTYRDDDDSFMLFLVTKVGLLSIRKEKENFWRSPQKINHKTY